MNPVGWQCPLRLNISRTNDHVVDQNCVSLSPRGLCHEICSQCLLQCLGYGTELV